MRSIGVRGEVHGEACEVLEVDTSITELLGGMECDLVTKIVGLLHVEGDKLVMVTELLFLTCELHGIELDCK